MRFGQHFEQQKIPEWASKYIDYELLEKLLAELPPPPPPKPVENRLMTITGSFEDPLVRDSISLYHADSWDSTSEKNEPLDDWMEQVNANLQKVEKFCTDKNRDYKQELDDVVQYMEDNKDTNNPLLKISDHYDPRHRIPSLMRALQLIHRNYWSLEIFLEINQLAILKLLKKLEKTISKEAYGQYERNLQSELPDLQKTISYFRKSIYNLIATHITNNDLNKAKALMKKNDFVYNPTDIFIIAFCIGVSIVTTVIGGLIMGELYEVRAINPSFCVYRVLLSFIFVIWMAGIVMYVFERYSVNWVYILEIKQRTPISYIKIIKIASILTAIWGIAFVSHALFHAKYDFKEADIVTMLLFWGYISCWLIPCHVLYRSIRIELFWIMTHVVIAPFGPVGFGDFLTADIITSLSKPMADLYRSFCYLCSSAWYEDRPGDCQNEVYGLYIFSMIPYYYRFWQCVNRYYTTKMWFPHLLNAGKYGSGILATTLGYMAVSPHNPELSKVVHIIVYAAATLYMLVWDLTMDFGLLRLLREKTKKQKMFPNYFYIYVAISDSIYRYGWALTLMPDSMLTNKYIHVDIVLLIVCLLEIFRRGQWAVFRIEWEKFNNLEKYRQVYLIPKMPKFIDEGS